MRFCFLWIFLDLILNHETYFPDLKWWRNPSGFRRKSCGMGWRGLTWKINWLIYNDIPNGIKQNERLSTVIIFFTILTHLEKRCVNVHSPQKNVLYILSVAQNPNAGQNIPQLSLSCGVNGSLDLDSLCIWIAIQFIHFVLMLPFYFHNNQWIALRFL